MKGIGKKSQWERVHRDWKSGRKYMLTIRAANMQHMEIQPFTVSKSKSRPETLQEHIRK